MFTAIALSASLSALSPAVRADVECLSVFSFIAGEDAKEADRSGAVGGLLYYLGRIKAREPDLALNELLVELVQSEEFLDSLPSHGQRCASEMVATGEALTALGEAMSKVAEANGPGS